MTWFIGVDFRGTSGYVTDPSGYGPPGYVFEGGTAVDYTSGRGYGWETVATGVLGALDYTTANDVSSDTRLAGVGYVNDPNQVTFRIDLPAANEQYSVQLAVGVPSGQYSNEMRAELFDGTSSLGVIVNDQTTTITTFGYFDGWDAQDNFYSSNTPGGGWIANNPLGGGGSGAKTFTFTTTILRLTIGGSGSGSQSSVAHLAVMQLATPKSGGLLPLGLGGTLYAADCLWRNRTIGRRKFIRGIWR